MRYFCFLVALLWPVSAVWAADSYKVNAGATLTVTEHSACAVITNGLSQALFVPTKSAAEWTSFRTNAPAGVTVSACNCAANQTVNWAPGCSALSGALLANGASRSVNNTASGYTGSRTIQCNNGVLAQSGGSCAAASSPVSLRSATSVSWGSPIGAITIPASTQAKDVIVLIDRADGDEAKPAYKIPTGFTELQHWTSSKRRQVMSYKIAVAADSGKVISGMTHNGDDLDKILLVFNANAVSVTPGSFVSAPAASQTVPAAGKPTPLIVIGAVGKTNTAATFTMSPAMDGSRYEGTVAAGWKIYNSSPANVTVGAGTNTTLQSGYLRIGQ